MTRRAPIFAFCAIDLDELVSIERDQHRRTLKLVFLGTLAEKPEVSRIDERKQEPAITGEDFCLQPIKPAKEGGGVARFLKGALKPVPIPRRERIEFRVGGKGHRRTLRRRARDGRQTEKTRAND